MQIHNPGNERIKRRYLTYLKETRGFSEHSLDQVAKAISRYEADTRFRDFRLFHIEQVKAFKQHLAEQRGARTKELLSHATIYSTLSALKAFFCGSLASRVLRRVFPSVIGITSTHRESPLERFSVDVNRNS
jgi:site-specific recombinase XerD